MLTFNIDLQLNEEFDESTPDGRDVKALCTFEDGKIVTVQKAKNEKHKSTKVILILFNPEIYLLVLSLFAR